MTITLVTLGLAPLASWEHGPSLAVEPTSAALSALWATLRAEPTSEAVLFWDAAIGHVPTAATLRAMLSESADVVHAGPLLGVGALPRSLEFVQPAWMLGYENPVSEPFSSFRLSFSACLIRRDVLVMLDGPSPQYASLAGAALEYGHRLRASGAIMRCDRALLPQDHAPVVGGPLPIADELRFARDRFGRSWGRWSALRAALTGLSSTGAANAAWRIVGAERTDRRAGVLRRADHPTIDVGPDETVTVLIPTIERPAYLRSTLAHLRHQTHPLHQVIIIDQTPIESRDLSYLDEYSDLPIVSIVLEASGQCSSRNAGLMRATGKWVLFIDDDVDLPPDTIARHLQVCHRFGADACCGVAEEEGVPKVPVSAQFIQMSSVFNGNNTLALRDAVEQAGGFDLAYNKGIRADGDLGQRIHAAGRLILLDPSNSVFHHHAPRGGLRVHKARVVTRATSRMSITGRNLLTPSEAYLALRHFGEGALREMFWIRAASSLRMEGTLLRRGLRFVVALARLPDTIRRQRAAVAQGRTLLQSYPQFQLGAARESVRASSRTPIDYVGSGVVAAAAPVSHSAY